MKTKKKILIAVITLCLLGYVIQMIRLDKALNDLEDKFDKVCSAQYHGNDKYSELCKLIEVRNQFFKDNYGRGGLSKWTSWLTAPFGNSQTLNLPILYNPLSLFQKIDDSAIKKYFRKH